MRRLLPVLLLAVLMLAGGPVPSAGAHPMATSAVLLSIGDDRVEGEVQLPLDRLAIAVHRDLTPESVVGADRTFLHAYAAAHISAADATDHHPWSVTLGTGTTRTIDGTAHLVYPISIRPPAGRSVTDFDLRYDVIVEELLTHRVIVTVASKTLGVFDWDTKSLKVPVDRESWLSGFVAAARLGIEHVGTGADHLLFLLMLLIPAPLLAAGGRWRAAESRSARRTLVRVVHVVSAFALGHSLTLALAATGVVDLPTRPVETAIALSIAVSAAHALRPLVARGEVVIAVGFGLVHGLAFASALGELGLERGSLVTTLLGFNLGIEVTQLLVVALLMPSLLVLSRTAAYPAFRIGTAAVGLLFSTSWMLERATLTTTDPFEGVQTWLVGHPLLVALSVATLAAGARLLLYESAAAPGRAGSARRER